MDLSCELIGSKATYYVDGRLAIDTAPELDDAIRELPEEITDIEVDLTKATYLSSAGLRVLVNAHKLVSTRGGVLVVSHPADEVRDILDMTGIGEYISIVD